MAPHELCASVKGPVYQHSLAVQEPYTSYRGVWLVPPGHLLVLEDGVARLSMYSSWPDVGGNSVDTSHVDRVLEDLLRTRLDHSQTIGIPFSAGVDSGIIAFAAEALGVRYHLFTVTEMFGAETEEAYYIQKRLERLRNAAGITILKCGEEEYLSALREMYLPDYYDSEKFDTGNVPAHTVFAAMHAQGIRVCVDGGGGDELFHGYAFRDDFRPVAGWPRVFGSAEYFYSLFTTLLDYTAKTDRAGAHFSIETRYPYQSSRLLRAAARLRITDELKWPLRRFLLSKLPYGAPLAPDLTLKFGFSLKNCDREAVIRDLKRTWCEMNGIAQLPTGRPLRFPFRIGLPLPGEAAATARRRPTGPLEEGLPEGEAE